MFYSTDLTDAVFKGPNPFVQLRDKVIDEILNITKVVYRGSATPNKRLSDMVEATTYLMVTSPTPEYLKGLYGWLMWCSMTGKSYAYTLDTIIHDLDLYMEEGNEPWFSPRTAGYQKYLTGAAGIDHTGC